MYVTSVSGPKMYEIDRSGLEAFSKSEDDLFETTSTGEQMQFFHVISVDGPKLVYQAYTADGELYDAVVLTKDPYGVTTASSIDSQE